MTLRFGLEVLLPEHPWATLFPAAWCEEARSWADCLGCAVLPNASCSCTAEANLKAGRYMKILE